MASNNSISQSTEELNNRARILFNKGVQTEKKGENEIAMNIYKLVIKLNPNLREAFINLGNLLSKFKKYRLALASFRRALTLKEDFVILFNLGVLFYRVRRYKAAANMFEKALEQKNNFTRLNILLGFTYTQLQKFSEAEKSYHCVLESNPEHPQAIYALTYLYLRNRNYAKAQIFVKKLIKIDPASPEIQALDTRIQFFQNEKMDMDEKTLSQYLLKMTEKEPGYHQYNEFIIEDRKKEPEKYKKLDKEINTKINDLRHQYLESKTLDSKDWMDLSLSYLFQGDSSKAVKALTKARSQLSA